MSSWGWGWNFFNLQAENDFSIFGSKSVISFSFSAKTLGSSLKLICAHIFSKNLEKDDENDSPVVGVAMGGGIFVKLRSNRFKIWCQVGGGCENFYIYSR